jgi:hypothetical protein
MPNQLILTNTNDSQILIYQSQTQTILFTHKISKNQNFDCKMTFLKILVKPNKKVDKVYWQEEHLFELEDKILIDFYADSNG